MFKRKNNRLKNYDYAMPNYYFITVCTQNRQEYFGEIINYQMVLNEAGQAAERFWVEIPNHYRNIELDEFIIMPNHVHAIVFIKPQEDSKQNVNLSTIVGSYKNVTSKTIHRLLGQNFNWQKSFYDNIIRKDESLDRIREYIRNNPLKWEFDRNNNENLWM